MPNTETSAAPRNTEEQLVGRACRPVVGDRFVRWTPQVKTIDVLQVGPHHVGFSYDGPMGACDMTVSPAEWETLVRRTFANGCEFIPANAHALAEERSDDSVQADVGTLDRKDGDV